jgi:hypothetical protein
MYWWHKAAELVRRGTVRQFGFIATNSLRQTFNRRVIQPHLEAENPLSIVFAIPDHPWVDSALGAAVRISMTVGRKGDAAGHLNLVTRSTMEISALPSHWLRQRVGFTRICPSAWNWTRTARSLRANSELSCPGMKLHGAGFIVTREQATKLGLGNISGVEKHIREYRNGRDLTQTPRGVMVIDLFGLDRYASSQSFPEVYQWVYERVKPERDHNKGLSYARIGGFSVKTNAKLRQQLGLSRILRRSKRQGIACSNSSMPEFFPTTCVICVAHDDAFVLGVLSSRIHVTWALAAGGRLGVGNDPRYNKSVCFEPFPFPLPTESQQSRIRELGEQLDAHRKRQQGLHPALTMTGMYNVLEKLRGGESLTAKEQTIHQQGLVSVLRQIHDELDAAVADAYGWPTDLTDEQILERLVALNHQRADEERRGIIRWLRPEFQNPDGRTQQAIAAELSETPAKTTKGRGGQAALAQIALGPSRRGPNGTGRTGRPGRRSGDRQTLHRRQQGPHRRTARNPRVAGQSPPTGQRPLRPRLNPPDDQPRIGKVISTRPGVFNLCLSRPIGLIPFLFRVEAVLECGGLTPLSFCVSFAFCMIAVGGAERKKGTAKAASSHRTPKKANRPVGNKNRYVPGVQNWAKTVQTEHATPDPFRRFHQEIHGRVLNCRVLQGSGTELAAGSCGSSGKRPASGS